MAKIVESNNRKFMRVAYTLMLRDIETRGLFYQNLRCDYLADCKSLI